MSTTHDATADELAKPPPTTTLDHSGAAAGDQAGDDSFEDASSTHNHNPDADVDPALAADLKPGQEASEGNKLKVLIGVLKKVVGVKDLAAIRFSLPATLLEPVVSVTSLSLSLPWLARRFLRRHGGTLTRTLSSCFFAPARPQPNLEYWTYLDRADLWATIPDLDDPLDRMLGVVRLALTKELKYVKGKVCKPYNSVLGEHFRCHWQTETPRITSAGDLVPVQALEPGSRAPAPSSSPAPESASRPPRTARRTRTSTRAPPRGRRTAPPPRPRAAARAVSAASGQATRLPRSMEALERARPSSVGCRGY